MRVSSDRGLMLKTSASFHDGNLTPITKFCSFKLSQPELYFELWIIFSFSHFLLPVPTNLHSTYSYLLCWKIKHVTLNQIKSNKSCKTMVVSENWEKKKLNIEQGGWKLWQHHAGLNNNNSDFGPLPINCNIIVS